MAGDLPPQTPRKSSGIPESSDMLLREADSDAFAALFGDAYRRCFSAPFVAPLTEPESHRLSVDIEASTGLEIGWKSLKNYSSFLLGRATRPENPSVPTLDTLARYVAGAALTTDDERRATARHYPYWYRYRDGRRQAALASTCALSTDGPAAVADARPSSIEMAPAPGGRSRYGTRALIGGVLVLVAVFVAAALVVRAVDHANSPPPARDEFDDVSAGALARHGWFVQAPDSAHWNRRGEKPGHLTLFTLAGDNWPQSHRVPVIRNLLVRAIPFDCFSADIRLTQFFPHQNWQQAGILLLEDTLLADRSVRLSIGYNDFSGGFPQTREVIVQGITSLGQASTKPDEIVHHQLFVVDSATTSLVRQNLESSALRIERRGSQLRFFYSAGPMASAPFKEAGVTTFDFRPAYVAIFAIRGFSTAANDEPVQVDAFDLARVSCGA